jgi:hypothetical protein
MQTKSRQSADQRLFEPLDANAAEPWEDQADIRQSDFQARASAAGADFKLSAMEYLKSAGAFVVRKAFRLCDVPVDAEIQGRDGIRLLVLARGTPDDTSKSGLRRLDTVQKVGFVAMVLSLHQTLPVVIVTSHLPRPKTAASKQLSRLNEYAADVVATTGDLRGYQRLLGRLEGDSRADGLRPWAIGPDINQPELWP